jgi:hypothetical protein
MGVGFGQSTAISNPMRMSIVRSFPWLDCGQSNACGRIRSFTAAKAQSDRRVHGRRYQLHELGDTRVNPFTRDRTQLGFPTGTLNANDFLF